MVRAVSWGTMSGASCRQGSIPRSFSFDLMSQQGTEIESTCCLVSSFLGRIFTCFILNKFLTTFRKYHFTLSSLLNALPLSRFTFPALRSLWGPVALPGPESLTLVGGVALTLLQDVSLSPRGVHPWLVDCCQP